MRATARKATFDAATAPRRRMIAKIHVAKKELGLADDDYRAVMLRVASQDSAAKCTDAQLVAIVKEFERLGFNAQSRSGVARAADHPSAKKARALWISLHQLGAVRNPNDAALEAFATRQLGVERLQWANQALVYRLIEALKAMGERAGWSQDLAGIAANNTVRVLKLRLVDRLLEMLKIDGLAPRDWSVATAAYRLGGIEIAAMPTAWSLSEMDVVAALFAAKRKNPAKIAGQQGDIA
jgi:phage gp16-like protein